MTTDADQELIDYYRVNQPELDRHRRLQERQSLVVAKLSLTATPSDIERELGISSRVLEWHLDEVEELIQLEAKKTGLSWRICVDRLLEKSWPVP